jgi:hypothetical protein
MIQKLLCSLTYMLYEFYLRLQFDYNQDKYTKVKRIGIRKHHRSVSLTLSENNALIIFAIVICLVLRLVIGEAYSELDLLIQFIPGIVISWSSFYFLLDK